MLRQSGDVGVVVQCKKCNELEILADPTPPRGLRSQSLRAKRRAGVEGNEREVDVMQCHKGEGGSERDSRGQEAGDDGPETERRREFKAVRLEARVVWGMSLM